MTKLKDKLAQSIEQNIARHTAAQQVVDDPLLSGEHRKSGAERGFMIDITRVDSSPYQVRSLDDNHVDGLAESIVSTENDLISPVIVRKKGDRYEIISGHHRVEAYRRLGLFQIPAIVRDMTDESTAKALTAANVAKGLTDYELYKQIALLFQHGYIHSNSDAARLLGRVRQDIIRYQAFGKMPKAVIDLLEKRHNHIGASLAKDLAELIDQGHTDLVVDACQRLYDGLIKSQATVLLWIHQKLAERPIHYEFKVLDSSGKVAGRLVMSRNGIRVTGKRLDYAKINDLLKESLPRMMLD